MKKLIFIGLIAVAPLCKAADPYASWDQAVQDIPNLLNQDTLILSFRGITAIPVNRNFPNLKGLYLNNNQIAKIPDNFNLNFPNLESLDLDTNQIVAIPKNLANLRNLKELNLSNNRIEDEGFDPQKILQQFPGLKLLVLNGNPLTQKKVNALRAAATHTHPNLRILALNLTKPPVIVKPAKRQPANR